MTTNTAGHSAADHREIAVEALRQAGALADLLGAKATAQLNDGEEMNADTVEPAVRAILGKIREAESSLAAMS